MASSRISTGPLVKTKTGLEKTPRMATIQGDFLQTSSNASETSSDACRVKDVLSRLPAVSQKFAKYWICQARLMEQEGNLDVLPMFEEAVRVVLEVHL
ncbi:hypothetical protein GOODEAATRI_027571 [Goodea atripinnis]|uniref:Uncharacterized protein n=1 Tax=Goodea atripinnis TaxID=208336 RepID=A0ABV0N4V1_9TELE